MRVEGQVRGGRGRGRRRRLGTADRRVHDPLPPDPTRPFDTGGAILSAVGLVTQNTRWLLLMGTSFVVAAYLQVVRGYDAIQTGVIFTAATVGLLVSSLAAERLAKRRPQRTPAPADALAPSP